VYDFQKNEMKIATSMMYAVKATELLDEPAADDEDEVIEEQNEEECNAYV